jgi:predicted transcriptional regulator
MDIGAEKAEVIKRVEKVHDLALIRAIKNLLDFGLSKQKEDEDALNKSIQQGLKESSQGNVTPHDQVMKEIGSRYKA